MNLNMTFANEYHFIKADFSIDLTDDGIDISVNETHLIKAEPLIKVTDEEIIKFFNDLHLPDKSRTFKVTFSKEFNSIYIK